MAGKQGKRNGKRPYGRGKKSNSKRNGYCPDQGQDQYDAREGARAPGGNDISWYSKYPELLAAAGQLPYPYRPGMQMPVGYVSPGNSGAKYPNFTVPGILCLDWMPSVGFSEDVTSPASIACKELYARIRSAFSGSLDADPPDIMIYLMSLDSIFSAIAALKRMYRVINAYTPQNYLVPQALFCAMNQCNPEIFQEFVKNKVAFFGMINELIHMTERFRCPAVMDVFNRHYWMNDNVYTDARSANAQLYCFRPVAFYQYDLLDTPDDVLAGGLKLLRFPGFTSPENAYNHVRNMIAALAQSDDAYTISGYLARAFEGVPSFGVDLLKYDETLDFQYNEEVLSQIENATSFPDLQEVVSAIAAGNFDVTQDPKTNTILAKQIVNYTASSTSVWYEYLEGLDTIINIRNDMPTVADSVVATRLKSWLTPIPGSTTSFYAHGSTEMVESIVLYDGTVDSKGIYNYYRVPGYVVTGGSAFTVDAIRPCVKLISFDWSPMVWFIIQSSGSDPTYEAMMLWDIHNITPISRPTLDELNRVCIYSEFNAFNV